VINIVGGGETYVFSAFHPPDASCHLRFASCSLTLVRVWALRSETPVTILFRVLSSLCSNLVGCSFKPSIGCGTRCIRTPVTLYSEPSRRFCEKCAVVSNISDFALDCGFCSTVKVTERVIMHRNLNWHFGWGNPKQRVFFAQQLSCMCRHNLKLPSIPRASNGSRHRTHHMHNVVAAVQFVRGWHPPSIPPAVFASASDAVALDVVIEKGLGMLSMAPSSSSE